MDTHNSGVRFFGSGNNPNLRGRFGTIAASHAVNSPMFFIYRSDLKLLDNAGFTPGAALKFKLQPYTTDLDYDLSSVSETSYTVVGFGDLPTPTVSPAPCPFTGILDVTVSNPPAGCVARFTRDGSPVTGSSHEWFGGPPPYIGIHLQHTTTIRVRFYSVSERTIQRGVHWNVDQGVRYPATDPAVRCSQLEFQWHAAAYFG